MERNGLFNNIYQNVQCILSSDAYRGILFLANGLFEREQLRIGDYVSLNINLKPQRD